MFKSRFGKKTNKNRPKVVQEKCSGVDYGIDGLCIRQCKRSVNELEWWDTRRDLGCDEWKEL